MHRYGETNGTRALCHGASSAGIASSFVPFHRIITNTVKNQSQLLPLPTFLISRCAFLSTETGLTLGVGFQILLFSVSSLPPIIITCGHVVPS